MRGTGIPVGVKYLCNRWDFKSRSILILFVTFLAYSSYSVSRKPGVIFNAWLNEPDGFLLPWPAGKVFTKAASRSEIGLAQGWAPFTGPGGKLRSRMIDMAFLLCYTITTFLVGFLGHIVDLRWILSLGMLGTSFCCFLFGSGFFLRIHSFSFYLWVQAISGVFQATGWPPVVATVGNWFSEQRGITFGLWGSHSGIGSIIGSLMAAELINHGWGWSYIVAGILMAVGALLVFCFLTQYPEAALVGNSEPRMEEQIPLRYASAWAVPGIKPYSASIFFSRMAASSLISWLPFYLAHTAIGGEFMSTASAGNLAILFDVGGIFGGLVAGILVDRYEAPATTAASFTMLGIPALLLFGKYGEISQAVNILLMVFAGFAISGSGALITTAVSAKIAGELRGAEGAIVTVTSIIEGVGSVGGLVGTLLTGFFPWKGLVSVFALLSLTEFIAAVCLSRMIMMEYTRGSHGLAAGTTGEQLLDTQ